MPLKAKKFHLDQTEYQYIGKINATYLHDQFSYSTMYLKKKTFFTCHFRQIIKMVVRVNLNLINSIYYNINLRPQMGHNLDFIQAINSKRNKKFKNDLRKFFLGKTLQIKRFYILYTTIHNTKSSSFYIMLQQTFVIFQRIICIYK